MKAIEPRLGGIWDSVFNARVRETMDHTFLTLVAAYRLFHGLDGLNCDLGTNIGLDDLKDCQFDDVSRLMFIHDLHKLVGNPGHPEKGADFLDAFVIGVVRYHAAFGIIHTGEAPLTSLEPVATWVGELPPEKREAVLSMLSVVTMIDAASIGFLNEARVQTYRYIRDLIPKVVAGEKTFDTEAQQEAPERLLRLIGSNNRMVADLGLIGQAVAEFERWEDLKSRLAWARFDAGVYVLEPLVRYLIDRPKYPMAFTEVIHLNEEHLPALKVWLERLCDVTKDVDASLKTIVTIDLNPYSIKNDKNLEAFEKWANLEKAPGTFSGPATNPPPQG